MVSRGSSSDSKPLQVSRTFLSILTDLNNAVVLMIVTRFFLFLTPPVSLTILWSLYRAHQLQLKLVSPLPLCSIVFSVPLQGLGTYLSFRLISTRTAKSTIR